eukprot:scpid58782/ scgid16895/ 
MPVMAGRRRWRLAIADTIFGACMVLQLLLACSSQAQGQTSSLCNSECPPLRVPVNAVLHQNGTNVGNTTVIKCDSKSRQVGGDTSRTCLPNGRWTGYDITCYTYVSLLSCSFEYSFLYCGMRLPPNASITEEKGYRVLKVDPASKTNHIFSTYSLLAKNKCRVYIDLIGRPSTPLVIKVGNTALPYYGWLNGITGVYSVNSDLAFHSGPVSIMFTSNAICNVFKIDFFGECPVQATNDSACKHGSTYIASAQRCIPDCPGPVCPTDLVHCNISVGPCQGWTNQIQGNTATFHYLGPIMKPLVNQVQGGIEPVIVFRTTGTPGSKITVEVTSALTRLTLRRKTLTADSTGVYTVSSLVSLNDTTLQTSASYLSIQGSGKLTYLTTRLPQLYARGICNFNMGKFCNLLGLKYVDGERLKSASYASSSAVPNVGGYLRLFFSARLFRNFYQTLPAECTITLRITPDGAWDLRRDKPGTPSISSTTKITIEYQTKKMGTCRGDIEDCWQTTRPVSTITRSINVTSVWTPITLGPFGTFTPPASGGKIKLTVSVTRETYVDDVEMAGCGTQRYCVFDDPCQAGGVCVEAYNPSGYECLCPENRSGIHCEKACVNPTTAPTTTPTT